MIRLFGILDEFFLKLFFKNPGKLAFPLLFLFSSRCFSREERVCFLNVKKSILKQGDKIFPTELTQVLIIALLVAVGYYCTRDGSL